MPAAIAAATGRDRSRSGRRTGRWRPARTQRGSRAAKRSPARRTSAAPDWRRGRRSLRRRLDRFVEDRVAVSFSRVRYMPEQKGDAFYDLGDTLQDQQQKADRDQNFDGPPQQAAG